MHLKTGLELIHLTLAEVVTSPSLSQTQALILGQSHQILVLKDAMISIRYQKHIEMMVRQESTGERDSVTITSPQQQNTSEP